jgi:hypothetical protein
MPTRPILNACTLVGKPEYFPPLYCISEYHGIPCDCRADVPPAQEVGPGVVDTPRSPKADPPGKVESPVSTLASPRKPRKSRRVEFSCRLISATVEINGSSYYVEPLAIDPSIGPVAYRLSKTVGDGAVYDVHEDVFGVAHCDCPSHVNDHEGNDLKGCKHCVALRHFGLLEPLPAKLPTPRPEPPYRVVNDIIDTPDVAELAAAWEPTPCCEPSEPAPCLACEPAAVELDPEPIAGDDAREPTPEPSEEEDWGDDDVVGLAPEGEARLGMLEVVELEVTRFRAMGSAVGALMAAHMADLASELRILGQPNDPATFYSRRSALMASRS